MTEVLQHLKDYRKLKNRGEETVYNSELRNYIIEVNGLKLTEELKKYLGTEVYLAQVDYRDEKKEEYKKEMLSNGWLELTQETEHRGKILLQAKKQTDWLTQKIEQEAKIIESITGYDEKKNRITELFIIPKGKRSRGWYVSNLENAFYKPL